jgi:hypothetical protein
VPRTLTIEDVPPITPNMTPRQVSVVRACGVLRVSDAAEALGLNRQYLVRVLTQARNRYREWRYGLPRGSNAGHRKAGPRGPAR